MLVLPGTLQRVALANPIPLGLWSPDLTIELYLTSKCEFFAAVTLNLKFISGNVNYDEYVPDVMLMNIPLFVCAADPK